MSQSTRLLVVGLIIGLVGWAAVLHARRGQMTSNDELERVASATVPPIGTIAARTSGPALYREHCAACHGEQGEGRAPVFPPLVGSSRVDGESAVLIRIVLNGLHGPIRVGGVAYDGTMPGLGDSLDDEEIAATLTHVRANWGHSAPRVDAITVGNVRAMSASRVDAWSDVELSGLEPARDVR